MRKVMKFEIYLLATLLGIFILLETFAFPIHAEGEWKDTIYRVYQSNDQLTQTEMDDLDNLARGFVKDWKLDLVLMVVNSDNYSGDMGEQALSFYDYNGYGYGEDHSGIVACYDEDSKKIVIRTVGKAGDFIPESFIDYYEDYLPTLFDNYGNYGVLYGAYKTISSYMTKNFENASVTDALGNVTKSEGEDTGNRSSGNSEDTKDYNVSSGACDFADRDSFGLPSRNNAEDKPSWYPKDVEAFKEYHDSEIPRVVDIADIFTAEEETAMKEKIEEVSAETGKDVVILTDTNTYGMERETYVYDFYDFCGYGFGDTYDGMCLFVCMDPNNRGFVASATGVVEDLYTEEIANEMDDVLYTYMVDGRYGEGVLDWIGNLYTLYTKGVPFYPEWLPEKEDRDSFVRINNSDSPRVYDSANLFASEDINKYLASVSEIKEKYGIDVVVHTTKRTYNMADEEYADSFYLYNGFGMGTSYDGIMLTIIADGNNRSIVTAYGKGKDKLTKINHKRLVEQTDSDVEYSRFDYGVETFLKNVAHMEKTGRVNKTAGTWILWGLVAALTGAIVGGIALAGAKSKMETVRSAFDAHQYLDGNKNVERFSDTLLDESTTKKKIVHQSYSSDSRSSGSSSSRSTYRSHSSGSSGRSHTSSTRNF